MIETGRPVSHVAAEVGVGEQVLGRWVRLQRQAAGAVDTGAVLDVDERATLSACGATATTMAVRVLWATVVREIMVEVSGAT